MHHLRSQTNKPTTLVWNIKVETLQITNVFLLMCFNQNAFRKLVSNRLQLYVLSLWHPSSEVIKPSPLHGMTLFQQLRNKLPLPTTKSWSWLSRSSWCFKSCQQVSFAHYTRATQCVCFTWFQSASRVWFGSDISRHKFTVWDIK